MSWQDYVDKQLLASGFVNHAAIIGIDGSLWAKSAAFNVNISTILCTFYYVPSWLSRVATSILSEISPCVPNWWGGAHTVVQSSLTHGSRHIWARSWPHFPSLFLFLCSTHLSIGESKFQPSIWTMSFKRRERRDTPNSLLHTQMCQPACVCVDLSRWRGWGLSMCHPDSSPSVDAMWSIILSLIMFWVYFQNRVIHFWLFCFRWHLLSWPPLPTTMGQQNTFKPMELRWQAPGSSSSLNLKGLCEARRTRVAFTAWRLRKVRLFIVFVHWVAYDWFFSLQQLLCPSTRSQQRPSKLPMWLRSWVNTSWATDTRETKERASTQGSGEKASQKWESGQILDASDQSGDHSASSALFSLVTKINFHSVW